MKDNKISLLVLFSLFLIVVLFFVSKNFQTSKYRTETKSDQIRSDTNNNSQHQTYINNRFGFKFDHPSTWINFTEADNGDGIKFIFPGENNTLEAWGSHLVWSFSQQSAPIERGIFDMNDGREATYLKEINGDRISYTVFFNHDDKQYGFQADLEEAVFEDIESEIMQVFKSFSLTGEGSDV